jgi:hypothetical protein
MTENTLTTTRELRGDSAYWIHVEGPANKLGLASRMAGAEARKWAKELAGEGERMRAMRVSSGGQYGSETFRHSVCYGISAV